jgi:hydroxymethylbilane synthase
MKDLPAKEHPFIVTAAIPGREDVADVLVSKNDLPLEKLPKGALIGTSSPRRTASIKRLRPDLEIAEIRGNVDSRIQKVRSGSYDATILARAGLNRIGKDFEVSQLLPIKEFLPAPGQGALAVEVLASNQELRSLVALLDDKVIRLITTAERSVLVGLDATCATAIGALAEFRAGQLTLMAELADPKTGEANFVLKTTFVDLTDIGKARALGIEVAKQLLAGEIAKRTGLA